MESQGPHYISYFLPHVELQRLINLLTEQGYQVTGPKVRDGAIVYDEITSTKQLPQGYRDEQSPGSYRLEKTSITNFFAWANGAQALKPVTFSSHEVLWKVERDEKGKLSFSEVKPKVVKRAVLGARACDIAALKMQDKVFLHGEYQDQYYRQRRDALFLIAVNCHFPAATCFCASTGDGPKASDGYDIVLTELASGFIIQAGSDEGQAIVEELGLAEPSDAQYFEAGNLALEAVQQQRRSIDKAAARTALFQQLDNDQWDKIAERCLSCGNCTMVCPTCFCHSENDEANLQGDEVHHTRQWDSCFTQGHSYIHGVTIRKQTSQRYRQWMTHKFSSWYEQFGDSGCVGCGRCMTWCPAEIDVTKELNTISEDKA